MSHVTNAANVANVITPPISINDKLKLQLEISISVRVIGQGCSQLDGCDGEFKWTSGYVDPQPVPGYAGFYNPTNGDIDADRQPAVAESRKVKEQRTQDGEMRQEVAIQTSDANHGQENTQESAAASRIRHYRTLRYFPRAAARRRLGRAAEMRTFPTRLRCSQAESVDSVAVTNGLPSPVTSSEESEPMSQDALLKLIRDAQNAIKIEAGQASEKEPQLAAPQILQEAKSECSEDATESEFCDRSEIQFRNPFESLRKRTDMDRPTSEMTSVTESSPVTEAEFLAEDHKTHYTLFNTVRRGFRSDHEERNKTSPRRSTISSLSEGDKSRSTNNLSDPDLSVFASPTMLNTSSNRGSAADFSAPLSELENQSIQEASTAAQPELATCLRKVDMASFGSDEDDRDVREMKKQMLRYELDDLEGKMRREKVGSWVDSDEMGKFMFNSIEESELE